MGKTPERIGVFPLPHLVLFPNALLPLHIFEPRYRALLRDALGGSRRILMAVLQPGYEKDYDACPAVYPIACTGKVVEHQRLPDGCSDLILKGESVAEIREFVSDEPYRVARIGVRPENGSFAEGPDAPARCRELHRLLERACPGCVDALRRRMHEDFDADCGLELLHTVAMHLPVGVERKLEWLACPGSLTRWEKVRETLGEMGEARARRERVIHRYQDLHPRDPNSN